MVAKYIDMISQRYRRHNIFHSLVNSSFSAATTPSTHQTLFLDDRIRIALTELQRSPMVDTHLADHGQVLDKRAVRHAHLVGLLKLADPQWIGDPLPFERLNKLQAFEVVIHRVGIVGVPVFRCHVTDG